MLTQCSYTQINHQVYNYGWRFLLIIYPNQINTNYYLYFNNMNTNEIGKSNPMSKLDCVFIYDIPKPPFMANAVSRAHLNGT